MSERLPRADESAGSRRLLALLTLLAPEARIDLWVERDETTGRGALSAERIAAARAALGGVQVHVMSHGWRSLSGALAGAAYDVVLFEFHAMAVRYAGFVRERQPGARVVIDSVDLHWARLATGATVGAESPRRARRMRGVELAAYRAADAVLVASRDDTSALAAEPGLPPVHEVPIIAPIRPRAAGPRAREALFVGHFDHAPNADGLRWFVREIWPRVWARDGGARLVVAGTRMTDEVRGSGAVPGVSVVGYVPDVAPLLDRAWLSIAPLRYGAGMKGKVVEAMASGVPVVTTPVGVQGLDVAAGEHALVAADAPAFVDAVAALLGDPARAERVGLAGQRHVAGLCSPAVVGPRLAAILDDVLRRPAVARRPAVRVPRLRGWLLAGQHVAVTRMRRQAQWLIHRA